MIPARIRWLTLGILLGFVLGAGLHFVYSHRFTGAAVLEHKVDAPSVIHEIQGLKELVSVKYVVQKVVGLEEQKTPFGAEKILLFVQADVLAGTDLQKLRDRDIVVGQDGEVVVSLPPPEIFHVVIDDDQTRVWDRNVTWWTPWVPYNQDLERRARVEAREVIAKAALDSGILVEARRNAEMAIRALLTRLGVKSIRFLSLT